MQTLRKDTTNIKWNNAFRATLLAVWWLLKTLFKLAIAAGSLLIALIATWLDKSDAKEETASDLSARSDYGLSNSDHNKLQNSYLGDDE